MEADEHLAMSALQHLAYCERQAALIHVDGVWIENGHTAAGRVVHERVETGEATRARSRVALRSVALRSDRLRLTGVADVVEVTRGEGSAGFLPVEYKRGDGAARRFDELQLGAQAIALEEMTGCRVEEGAIFYAKTKRRRAVAIDAALRARVEAMAARLHAIVRDRLVPPPPRDARCRECSLRAACCPELALPQGSLARAVAEALR